MLVTTHESELCHNREDHSFNLHCHKNLWSHSNILSASVFLNACFTPLTVGSMSVACGIPNAQHCPWVLLLNAVRWMMVGTVSHLWRDSSTRLVHVWQHLGSHHIFLPATSWVSSQLTWWLQYVEVLEVSCKKPNLFRRNKFSCFCMHKKYERMLKNDNLSVRKTVYF